MKIKLLFILFFVVCLNLRVYAQDSDFGVWGSFRVDKKISQKLAFAAEGELRLRNNTKTVDCWSGYGELTYSPFPFLKTGGGYTIIEYNKNDVGWVTKHRFNVFATGSYKIGNLGFALRERFQSTCVKDSPATNTIRSRIQVSYKKPKWKLSPYATVEFYNNVSPHNKGLEKTRYTIGSYYKTTKSSQFGLYYRFIDYKSSKYPNENILGIGYVISI